MKCSIRENASKFANILELGKSPSSFSFYFKNIVLASKLLGDFFFIKAFRRIFHQANTFYHWRVTNFFSMTMSKCWQACQSTKTNRKYNNPAFCIVHVELVVVHKHLWPSHTPHCFKKEKYYNNKKFVQYVLLQQMLNSNEF